MEKETGTAIQAKFKELSDEYKIRASFGYFLDVDSTALVTYNNINDDEMLYLCSIIIRRIAKKRGVTTDYVIEAMREGMADEDNVVVN